MKAIADAAERIVCAIFTAEEFEPSGVEYLRTRFTPIVAAELAAIVEERDALLRECKSWLLSEKRRWREVQELHSSVALINDAKEKEAACDTLLKRIDAVIGGG